MSFSWLPKEGYQLSVIQCYVQITSYHDVQNCLLSECHVIVCYLLHTLFKSFCMCTTLEVQFVCVQHQNQSKILI